MLWNWFGLGRDNRPALFTYWDGRRKRRVDPVTVEKVFTARLGRDWPEAIRQLAVPIPPGMGGDALDRAYADRLKHHDEAVVAICEAFDVQEYGRGEAVDAAGMPGAGLGRFELFDLLGEYQRYAVALMESARPFGRPQPRGSPGPDPSPPENGPVSTSAAPA